MLLSDLNVLSHLAALNVGAQLILESYNLALKEPDFFHKILVKLILVDFAALFGKQLHLLFDD